MQAAPDPKVLEHESADQAEQKVVQQVMDANGDGQLNLGDADDKLIELLIRQACPTASRTNIENIRNTIKKRVELAKQQGAVSELSMRKLSRSTSAPILPTKNWTRDREPGTCDD